MRRNLNGLHSPNWGGAIFRSEFIYIWVPGFLLWLVVWTFRRLSQNPPKPPAAAPPQ